MKNIERPGGQAGGGVGISEKLDDYTTARHPSEVSAHIIAAIEAATGQSVVKSGNGWRAVCPVHGTKDKNLVIWEAESRVALDCKSHHCDPAAIMEAAGLKLPDLFYQTRTKEQKVQATERQIKKALEQELLILLCWIADSYRNVFPINEKSDRDRVQLAIKRVSNGLNKLREAL